jgi:hypothetical protein
MLGLSEKRLEVLRGQARRANSETSMKTGLIVLALVFAVIAVVYFVLPAGSLPSFFPGFEPGSARVHAKHGITALAVAIVLFGIAWFAGRSPR